MFAGRMLGREAEVEVVVPGLLTMTTHATQLPEGLNWICKY